MSDTWDVDSYKTEYETEGHWKLRKKFMLAHKDKFPEDELVCLAQVFTNIEFMGCRYPDKTMVRVAELAKDVVEKYREERKHSLKRTFVAASEAASAKVKGHKGEETTPSKKLKTSSNESENEKESNIESTTLDSNESPTTVSSTRASKYGGVKTFNINTNDNSEKCVNKINGPSGEFVLIFGCEEDHPVSILQRSAALNKCTIKWDFEEGIGTLKVCKLYINDEFIKMGVGENMKSSKEITAAAAIAKLKETYYTIKAKSKFFSDTTIDSSHFVSTSQKNVPGKLGDDNVGSKLMKLMGWQGGGLGSQEQGIEEPITASLQVRRDGFGQSKGTSSSIEFKKKAREFIRVWMNSNSNQDLVFSSEFDSEERKVMHEVAQSFSLKSKSYGKAANRHLVISRKSEPWEIVQELKKTGGNSDKYELLYPKRCS